MIWPGIAVVALLIPLSAGEQPAPVNPNASPEARALLRYLYSISGRYTLSGQHNYPNTISRWTDRAYDFTTKYPAVFGQDFGFEAGDDKDSILARPALIEEIKRQYRNGAIPTLTWHAVRPTDDEPVSFRESVQGHLTDFEWNELLTPGSSLYRRWCAQVDLIAGFLKQLRDARVPVLWRPYHEVNGRWFWWGGRKGKNGSAALYRQLYDRLVNVHKLDNLVWVWNANSPGAGGMGPGPYADFFPGLEYADVLSADIYGEFKQSHYDDLLALAAGKPIALGEVGGIPSPEVLKAQPKWTWFMAWSELLEAVNPLELIRAVYDTPAVLNRDNPRVAEPMAAIRKASAEAAPEPVTPNASAEAKALLGRLYGAVGRGLLSGQDNDPRGGTDGRTLPSVTSDPAQSQTTQNDRLTHKLQSISASSARVSEITAKSPAIWGQDLGLASARPAIVEEAKRQHQAHAIIALSWRATRPAADDPAGKLTDFEWNELLSPGSSLHQRWCAQVDSVAGVLKQFEEAGIAVLWRPYPQPNGSRFWWAGRKGQRGSAALYRQLYDRLVEHHQLRNLVWVWEAAAPGFRPDSLGAYADFFPGLQYVDALAVDLEDGNYGFRRDGQLAVFGVGKPIGLGLAARVPAPATLVPSKWAWFLAPPNDGTGPDQSEALRTLYAAPRVMVR